MALQIELKGSSVQFGARSAMPRLGLLVSLWCWLIPVAHAQDVLRGHGGPVRALSLGADGRELVSGSFDTAVIVWDLGRSTAKRVLRFHDGAVNAVTVLPGDCIASGGEDRRIAV